MNPLCSFPNSFPLPSLSFPFPFFSFLLSEKAEFDFAAANEYLYHFVAFYCDCKHEILPLEAGYRICLVYNLLSDAKHAALPIPLPSAQMNHLATLIDQWHKNDAAPEYQCYILEHVYTEAQITGFKNRDRAVVDLLLRTIAHHSLDVVLYVGSIRFEESGSARVRYGGDWSPEEVDDSSLVFTPLKLLQPYGTSTAADDDPPLKIKRQIDLSTADLIQEDYFEGESADDESLEEATGNEGASFNRSYQRTALLLVRGSGYVQSNESAKTKRRKV